MFWYILAPVLIAALIAIAAFFTVNDEPVITAVMAFLLAFVVSILFSAALWADNSDNDWNNQCKALGGIPSETMCFKNHQPILVDGRYVQ